MNRIYTKLIGVSYDSHIRGSNDMSTFRHWDALKDEAAVLDAIESLLASSWRGRKIAEVHVVEVARADNWDPDRFSEKSAGAYVVLSNSTSEQLLLIPGTLEMACRKGTAVNRMATAPGMEFNDR
jgi:hypothetical protein